MPSQSVGPGSWPAIQPYRRLISSMAEFAGPVRNLASISGYDVKA